MKARMSTIVSDKKEFEQDKKKFVIVKNNTNK
jgi:hypothetical protein